MSSINEVTDSVMTGGSFAESKGWPFRQKHIGMACMLLDLGIADAVGV